MKSTSKKAVPAVAKDGFTEKEANEVTPPSKDNFSNKIVGFIDLGSNSARLLVVHLLPNGSYTVLNRIKHMVRLGENAFQTKQLQEPAIERTLVVLKAFADMCKTYNVKEVVAMATAATRSASNAQDFLERVKKCTGLKLSVISGKEEARLIYLGVSGGLPHSLGLRLFIDIGGGSTELVVANSETYENLDSLKLGCVRLTNRFLANHTGTVAPELFLKTVTIFAVKPCTTLNVYGRSLLLK